jgi:uncharacterized protein with HEPN domain
MVWTFHSSALTLTLPTHYPQVPWSAWQPTESRPVALGAALILRALIVIGAHHLAICQGARAGQDKAPEVIWRQIDDLMLRQG